MSDFDFYRLFKTLHVASAMLLAAGVGVEMLCGPMLSKARSVQDVRLLARLMVTAETFIIAPSFLFIVGFGYATAGRAHIDVNTTWLLIAQILFYLAAAVSMAFLRRAAKGLLKASEAAPDGPIPPNLLTMLKDPVPGIVGTLLTIIFFVIVYLMVAKPQF